MRKRVAAVIALAGVVVAALPATASTATPGRSRCIVMDNLTEKVLEAGLRDTPPEGYSPGDVGWYKNQLISPRGKVLADVEGTSDIIYVDEDNLWTIMDNTDTFADGAIRSNGITDATRLLANEWVSVPAVGVSGRYAGKTGTRSFVRTATEGIYDSKIRLC
jgi:hypothetical protein